jgi:hypothetical protein
MAYQKEHLQMIKFCQPQTHQLGTSIPETRVTLHQTSECMHPLRLHKHKTYDVHLRNIHEGTSAEALQ